MVGRFLLCKALLISKQGVGSAALWILWNCRGYNCVILLLVLILFLWLWLEARGFFIDYSAGFRLRHSGS